MGKAPLYRQIRDYIVEQIESGRWAANYQVPPERLLAEQFEVSRITAKNAILGLVNEGYLYRHQGKGTFVAKQRGMKSPASSATTSETRWGSKKMIGLILPWVEWNYSNLLFAAFESEIARLGYHVIFKRVEKSQESESRAIRELLELQVDGLVIVASQGQHFNDDIVRLVLNHFPVVLVEKYMRDLKANGVYCDTEKAGSLMGEFLVGKGMSDIGLVTYAPKFSVGVKERIFGFQSAMVSHGIPPVSDDRLLIVPTDILDGAYYSRRAFRHDSIAEFMASHRDLEAIATIDALLARLVCNVASEIGWTDLAIVCCDEPLFHSPVFPVAYVDQSPYEMGTIAAQMIVEAIRKKPPQHVLIKPKLIEI